jgi:hypothetical protein
MLVVAVEYQEVVDELTGDKALGLRRYEMGEDEWAIIAEMIQVLKVGRCSLFGFGFNKATRGFVDTSRASLLTLTHLVLRFLRMPPHFFLVRPPASPT